MNCPNDNAEMEKWESWGDYIQYRCPKCGFRTDNKQELEKIRVKSIKIRTHSRGQHFDIETTSHFISSMLLKSQQTKNKP
jgi:tRNA(Ile2) C34 agmatinyltransferase TiaS